MSNFEIKRGDIFFVTKYGQQTGSEQHPGRPAVIVSNDMNNKHSRVVQVVYCTTQPKEELPTHVKIQSTNQESTVLCEQVTPVSVEKLLSYHGSCNEDEMNRIDEAITIHLGLKKTANNKSEENKQDHSPKATITSVTLERDIYKKMYEQLLDKITSER